MSQRERRRGGRVECCQVCTIIKINLCLCSDNLAFQVRKSRLYVHTYLVTYVQVRVYSIKRPILLSEGKKKTKYIFSVRFLTSVSSFIQPPCLSYFPSIFPQALSDFLLVSSCLCFFRFIALRVSVRLFVGI